MKEIIQLNGNAEWGGAPAQYHRFYSIYGSGVSLLAGSTSRSIMKILELYERVSSSSAG